MDENKINEMENTEYDKKYNTIFSVCNKIEEFCNKFFNNDNKEISVKFFEKDDMEDVFKENSDRAMFLPIIVEISSSSMKKFYGICIAKTRDGYSWHVMIKANKIMFVRNPPICYSNPENIYNMSLDELNKEMNYLKASLDYISDNNDLTCGAVNENLIYNYDSVYNDIMKRMCGTNPASNELDTKLLTIFGKYKYSTTIINNINNYVMENKDILTAYHLIKLYEAAAYRVDGKNEIETLQRYIKSILLDIDIIKNSNNTYDVQTAKINTLLVIRSIFNKMNMVSENDKHILYELINKINYNNL